MIAPPPSPEDCEAIRQLIYGYCRGIDRADRDVLERCYWPDAIDDHAVVTSSAAEFIEACMPVLAQMTTVHMVANVLIEDIGPGIARVESYFQATHRLPGRTGRPDDEWTLFGRYLDRFERRGGAWRILHRTVVVDHQRQVPTTLPYAAFVPRAELLGSKNPDDPLYRILLGL